MLRVRCVTTRHGVVAMRSQPGRIGDQARQEILDSSVLVQLPQDGDGVRSMETGPEDEEGQNTAPDLSAGYCAVSDGEFPNLEGREGRPTVCVVGGFYSNS